MSNDTVRRQIDDLETAAFELADAAADCQDTPMGSAPEEAYRRYSNWERIVRDLANTLRTSLGLPERRPDVDAYDATGV